jgi:hypothetical protein
MANDDGFLSRWSRRKVQARTGEALPSEAPAPEKPQAAGPPVATQTAPQAASVTAGLAGQTPSNRLPASLDAAGAQAGAADQPNDAQTAVSPGQQPEQAAAAAAQAPLPTMQDVMALTKESDYSAFVQPSVDPAVRNAAMKKLFSDPFFNEMDGLDIYIDDYSQPNPLPMSLARKLTSAKVLNLFETPEEKTARLAAEAAKEAKEAEAKQTQPANTALENTSSTQTEQAPVIVQSTGQEAEANAIHAPVQSATQPDLIVGGAPAPTPESDVRGSDASRPTTP